MASRTQTAKLIVAVQDALRAQRLVQRPLIEPGSVRMLMDLRDSSQPIGDLTRATPTVTEFAAQKTLHELVEAGLVKVDEASSSAHLTDAGRAAVGTE